MEWSKEFENIDLYEDISRVTAEDILKAFRETGCHLLLVTAAVIRRFASSTTQTRKRVCREFDIEKDRISFRLTVPYNEERRRTASEAAKANASNLTLRCGITFF
mgnify:CR=1 FL=1